MALAIRFGDLMRSGEVTSYAELARLGRVTRARMTQVMSLLSLGPNIQEEILFLRRPETLRSNRFSELGIVVTIPLSNLSEGPGTQRSHGVFR